MKQSSGLVTSGHFAHRRRIAKIIGRVGEKYPFFFSLIFQLRIKPDPTIEAIAADGFNMSYNPEWVLESQAEEIMISICQVVMACGLTHHIRRENRNYKIWQVASKIVVGEILANAGVIRDWKRMMPGRTVEQVYDILKSDDSDDSGAGNNMSDDQGGFDDSDGDGDGQDDSDNESDLSDGLPEGVQDAIKDMHGEIRDYNPENTDNLDDDSIDPPDIKGEVDKWRNSVASAEQAARMADNVYYKCRGDSGSKSPDVLKGMIANELDWDDLIYRYFTDIEKTGYTWARPNKRFLSQGLYLPGVSSEPAGSITFVIDTSFSMGRNTLNAIWSNIKEAVSVNNLLDIRVIQCSDSVGKVDLYEMDNFPDWLEIDLGGGTILSKAFEYMDKEDIRSDLIIFASDMDNESWFEEYIPDEPIIWLHVHELGEEKIYDPPQHGEIVKLKVEDCSN